jgi:hypothetical protein
MKFWRLSKLSYLREQRFIETAKSIVILIEKENKNEAFRLTQEVLNPIFIKLKSEKRIFEKIVSIHEDILDLLRDYNEKRIEETKNDIELAEQFIR